MGSLTYKNSPTTVGKVRITSTYVGTKMNGDIVINLCTRFSYPNLYNCIFEASSADIPSQQIDISATSEDSVNTCCDLFKVSDHDLEFRMQLNLKNYDPSACTLCYDEPTSANDTIMTQVQDSKSDHVPNMNEKSTTLKQEQDHSHPYLFASCENVDTGGAVGEIATTLDDIDSDAVNPDPLESLNRMNQIRDQDFNLESTNDTISPVCSPGDDMIKEEMDIKFEPETSKTFPESHEKKLKIPRVLSKAKGELYGFKDKIVERVRYRKPKTRCVFCNADVLHFPRHLERKHRTEKEVMAICCLPKEDKKRSILIGNIRKRGNFTKISDNIISPVRRPREGKDDLSFMACPFCKGIYSAHYVRRHFSRCHLNKNTNES